MNDFKKCSPIVIDLGSYQTKVGFSGDDSPRCSIPSVFGSIKANDFRGCVLEYYIGSEARNRIDISKLYNPFEDGIIKSKDDLIALFRHVFDKELLVNSEKKHVIITTPINTQHVRYAIAEVLFDIYKISSLYINSPSSLALFAASKFSGVVLDSGESSSQVVAIFENSIIPQSAIRIPLAGLSINNYLQKVLKDHSHFFHGSSGRDLCRTIKEEHAFIIPEPNMASKYQCEPIDYVFPDNMSFKLGDERFKCTELLFSPKLNDIQCESVSEIVFESIMRCDLQLRSLLFSNIHIVGGTTLCTGFAQRLQNELLALSKKEKVEYPISIVSSPNRLNAAWVGGSIVGSLDLFQQMAVAAEEFKELGACVIDKKFY